MISFAEAWGGGTGAARRLAPDIRLLCGMLAFACAILTPLAWPGLALGSGVVAGWAAFCGMPWKRLRHTLVFAACLFLPLALLAFLTALLTGEDATGAWRVPALIAIRGTLSVLAAAATLSALDLADLRQAVALLPLPRALRTLLLQIAHQAALLSDETWRMGAALRVRGVASARFKTRVRGLCALPLIWLLRLTLRAERVGAAMAVRGFDGVGGGEARAKKVTLLDAIALGVALGLTAVVAWLHWQGVS